MKRKDIVKILQAKDTLENELLSEDSGFDVADFSFEEWVDMLCEKLKIKD